MPSPPKLTPMLEQYFEIKRQAPDSILLYRLGDFYEMFFEDAERAAPLLDLVLTSRGKGGDSETPMCGVPYHAADQYVAKLIRCGFSVALCDQIDDPSAPKGIVRREITRIVTPGTATESFITERDSCYLLSVHHGQSVGAAYLDVSTGDFFTRSYQSTSDPRLLDDVARFAPREIIVSRTGLESNHGDRSYMSVPVTPVDDAFFDVDRARQLLTRQFSTQTLRGFGMDENDARATAAGAALAYAISRHKKPMDHVRGLRNDHDGDYLLLDAATLENLEIFESRDASRPRASLWSVVNCTRTAMGTRTLRRWLGRPLRRSEAIFDRLDAVDELTRNRRTLESLTTKLSSIADLERLASRISLGVAGPRECLTLAESLLAVQELAALTGALQGPLLRDLSSRLDHVPSVTERIFAAIDRSAPLLARDGGAIRDGVDADLDELRSIARDSKTILMRIESDERERTGIGSLKIRFNSVFGYYIEISKSNLSRVPPEYMRKQTLVNAERFITPELKELEEKIVGAEEKSLAIELRIYDELLKRIAAEVPAVLATASAVGEVDVLGAFATNAVRQNLVRPVLSDNMEIHIREGRHPVIESISSERFIPNNTDVNRDEDGIQIITGPNMGGKSTYLRQVALIVLLGQTGSFVPAAEARLGVFDRIFTRVGASDHLARGESTFMVEMHETANILNNATDRSLIILDEVGRGTATFDGLSLAWAIVEFLHDWPGRKAITLFATHYHELTDLAKTKDRVSNQSVSVKEWNDQIIFLKKVVNGPADKSYGIHVAKLAGIPLTVIERAREILSTLERRERDIVEETIQQQGSNGKPRTTQMSLFSDRHGDILRELRSLAIENMSPIDALNKLNEIRNRLLES